MRSHCGRNVNTAISVSDFVHLKRNLTMTKNIGCCKLPPVRTVSVMYGSGSHVWTELHGKGEGTLKIFGKINCDDYGEKFSVLAEIYSINYCFC